MMLSAIGILLAAIALEVFICASVYYDSIAYTSVAANSTLSFADSVFILPPLYLTVTLKRFLWSNF